MTNKTLDALINDLEEKTPDELGYIVYAILNTLHSLGGKTPADSISYEIINEFTLNHTIPVIVNLGANLHQYNQDGSTPWMINFIKVGNIDGVRTLVDNGYDINTIHEGHSLLEFAIGNRKYDIGLLLTERGIKVNRNGNGTRCKNELEYLMKTADLINDKNANELFKQLIIQVDWDKEYRFDETFIDHPLVEILISLMNAKKNFDYTNSAPVIKSIAAVIRSGVQIDDLYKTPPWYGGMSFMEIIGMHLGLMLGVELQLDLNVVSSKYPNGLREEYVIRTRITTELNLWYEYMHEKIKEYDAPKHDAVYEMLKKCSKRFSFMQNESSRHIFRVGALRDELGDYSDEYEDVIMEDAGNLIVRYDGRVTIYRTQEDNDDLIGYFDNELDDLHDIPLD